MSQGKPLTHTYLRMKHFRSIAVSAVIGTFSIVTIPALAGTNPRTVSWLMDQTKEDCIKTAINVANKTGFTEDHDIARAKDYPSINFYAYSKAGPYTMTVYCDEKNGTTAIAVSGISFDGTNSLWNKVIETYNE